MRKIVAITGGNGAKLVPPILREFGHITSVLNLFDSGGSAGKIRQEFGVQAVGDIRRAFLSLSNNPLYKRASELRFPKESSLAGHTVGNLIILSYALKHGMEKAVEMLNEDLLVQGKVVPTSFDNSHLVAELENGELIRGETNIDVRTQSTDKKIKRLSLEPAASANPEAVRAIREADWITVGPGDVYSSLLPNFCVAGIPEALRESKAKKIYIGNIMTKFGETEGWSTSDFAALFEKHMGCGFDYLVFNSRQDVEGEHEELHKEFIRIDPREKAVIADVVNEGSIDRHDPAKLRKVLEGIICRQ